MAARFGRRKLLEAGASFGGIGASLAILPHADLLRLESSPQNLATPLEHLNRLITPTSSFFVRSHFGPPALDPDRVVEVGGLVRTRLSLRAADLKTTFRPITVTAALQCAGNGRALHSPPVPGLQWTHGAMGQATFTGARLRDVLERAGARKDAGHVHLLGADAPPKPTTPAFLRSIPMARALDPSTLVAWQMNGEDLTLAHGAPLRLVVPTWAGDHWIKWLTKVSVEESEATGYFMERAYRIPRSRVEPGADVAPGDMRPLTTFPVKSTIGAPLEGSRAAPGLQEVVGVALSGEAAIAKVEVSIDDGKSWRLAKLEGEAAPGRWNVFRFVFERAAPGKVRAIARATDRKGNVQPEHPDWNPSGYLWNGWHAVSWEVG